MATPYMNLVLPVVGPLGTQGPDWANEINASLTLIDEHDHSTSNGKKITPSGLNINQTLSLNNNQLSEIASLALQNLSSAPTASSLIYELGNELFFNDGTGTPVQITSGGAINVSGVGGIGGDYSTTPGVAVNYSDISKGYSFLQAPGVTAFIDSGPISIYRNLASSPFAKIQQQNTQAGNLTWSLPDNYPASTLPIKSSNLGVLEIGQIVAADIATDAVETAKIKDLNVTTGKLADLSITTGKLVDKNVTGAKIADETIDYQQIKVGGITTNRLADDMLTDAKVFSSANINRGKLRATNFSNVINVNTSTTSTGFVSLGSFTQTFESPWIYLTMTPQPNTDGYIKLRSTASGNYFGQFKIVQGSSFYTNTVGGFLDALDDYYYPLSMFSMLYPLGASGISTTIEFQIRVSNSALTMSIVNGRIRYVEI
jgi:hypothetical protein